MRTLVLNAGYEPLAVVTFRRALVLVLTGKASVVAEGDDPVVGPQDILGRPSVILLHRYIRPRYNTMTAVSRRGVLRRDGQRCAYCGKAAHTIDHVQPKSTGRRRFLGKPGGRLPAVQQRQGGPYPRRNGLEARALSRDRRRARSGRSRNWKSPRRTGIPSCCRSPPPERHGRCPATRLHRAAGSLLRIQRCALGWAGGIRCCYSRRRAVLASGRLAQSPPGIGGADPPGPRAAGRARRRHHRRRRPGPRDAAGRCADLPGGAAVRRPGRSHRRRTRGACEPTMRRPAAAAGAGPDPRAGLRHARGRCRRQGPARRAGGRAPEGDGVHGGLRRRAPAAPRRFLWHGRATTLRVLKPRSGAHLRTPPCSPFLLVLTCGELRVPPGSTDDVDTWDDASALGVSGRAPGHEPGRAARSSATEPDLGGKR